MTTSALNGLSSTVSVRLAPPLPPPTGPLDVADTARLIVQLSRGSPTVASQLVDAYTMRQPAALRDAVERSVAAQLRDDGTLRLPAVRGSVAEGAALRRFDNVLSAAPAVPVTTGLSDGQKFDVYASIVRIDGTQPAQDALRNAASNGEPTVLALRNETSTLANRGRGDYDDRIVVLRRDRDGTPHVHEFAGNTEPGAQYDARAGRQGRPAAPGYENVRANPREYGTDLNRDGQRDLGRLMEGTYRYERRAPYNGNVAFETVGAQRAERDVNGDGRFNTADAAANRLNGRRSETGDFGMYIHQGGVSGTESAGCQTIAGRNSADYGRFLGAIGRNDIFNYVLVNAR